MSSSLTTVTRSRSLDLLLMILVITLMVIPVKRILVYYKETPTKVSLTRIYSNGERESLATPESLDRVRAGLGHTRRAIDRFVNSSEYTELAEQGSSLEWQIHYSKNSLKFDQVEIYQPRSRL